MTELHQNTQRTSAPHAGVFSYPPGSTDLANCSVIVANRTGGQGKTLLTQLIHLCFENAGVEKTLASADTSDADRSSKLGKYFRNRVTELGLGARMDDVRNDPTRAVAHWDALGEMLYSGNAIIDLGANIVDSVWDWASARRAGSILKDGKRPAIVLAVPVLAQAQALEDAFVVLERSIRDEPNLPIAARILVLNEAGGSFERYGNNADLERLEAMKHNAGLRVVRLEQCRSEIWRTLERNHIPMRVAARLSTDQVAKEFQLDRFAASGARVDLLTWLEKAVGTFTRIGLVPSVQPSQESQR